MREPVHTTDACYNWKEYRLRRIARQMCAGKIEREPFVLSDSEKVAVALALCRRERSVQDEPFAVWVDQGSLRIRYGLIGKPQLFPWHYAAVLVGFGVVTPKIAHRAEQYRFRARSA